MEGWLRGLNPWFAKSVERNLSKVRILLLPQFHHRGEGDMYDDYDAEDEPVQEGMSNTEFIFLLTLTISIFIGCWYWLEII